MERNYRSNFGNEPLLLLKLNQNLVYMITNQNIQPANQNILVLLISLEKYQFVQDCALSVHKMLKCDVYSRVDFKFYDDNFYFLEINTLPGMTETSLFPMAAKRHGFSFKDIINKIIKLSLQK